MGVLACEDPDSFPAHTAAQPGRFSTAPCNLYSLFPGFPQTPIKSELASSSSDTAACNTPHSSALSLRSCRGQADRWGNSTNKRVFFSLILSCRPFCSLLRSLCLRAERKLMLIWLGESLLLFHHGNGEKFVCSGDGKVWSILLGTTKSGDFSCENFLVNGSRGGNCLFYLVDPCNSLLGKGRIVFPSADAGFCQ